MAPSSPHDLWTRAIVEQNQRWLTAYFVASTGDRSTADDLVQEVFRAALESQDSYDPTRPFGAWLRGIARHMLFQHYRRQARPGGALIPLDDGILDQLDRQAERAERQLIDPDHRGRRLAALRACLEKLSERARALLAGKYGERLTSQAIGERLGMRVNAVDVAISRSRRALETCIGRRLQSAEPCEGLGDV